MKRWGQYLAWFICLVITIVCIIFGIAIIITSIRGVIWLWFQLYL